MVADQVRQGGVENISFALEQVKAVRLRCPSKRHSEESGETGIDLAPMLDFVMNLLIFFIITTSFVKEAGVEVSRADALTAMHREKGNILIAIRPNGEIWMDRQAGGHPRGRDR